MAPTVIESYGIEHPAPQRGEIPPLTLCLALVAAPAAWCLQLVVIYGFASLACFQRGAPRHTLPEAWNALPATLLAVNLIALLVALAGLFDSHRIWLQTNTEGRGGHERLLHAGEGRTRFLAVIGIWASVWFALMIGFDTIALLGVPPCSG